MHFNSESQGDSTGGAMLVLRQGPSRSLDLGVHHPNMHAHNNDAGLMTGIGP